MQKFINRLIHDGIDVLIQPEGDILTVTLTKRGFEMSISRTYQFMGSEDAGAHFDKCLDDFLELMSKEGCVDWKE